MDGAPGSVPRWVLRPLWRWIPGPRSPAALADRIVSRRGFGRLSARLGRRFGEAIETGAGRRGGPPEAVSWEVGRTSCRFTFHDGVFDHPHGRVLVERWLACLPLLMAARRDRSARGSALLSLGDCGTGSGLSFCDFRSDARLIPDPAFLASHGYRAQKTAFASRPVAWGDREPLALWRGQTSGWHDADGVEARSWQDLPRVRLCRAGRTAEGRDRLDVGLTGLVQLADAASECATARENLAAEHIDWRVFSRWRYQIDIDGNSNAWEGLFVKLCSGSPVLKVASGFGFRQWYYGRLVPWQTVVPVAADLSDLFEKVDWLRGHDDAAREIGRAGRALADAMELDAEISGAMPIIAAALQDGA